MGIAQRLGMLPKATGLGEEYESFDRHGRSMGTAYETIDYFTLEQLQAAHDAGAASQAGWRLPAAKWLREKAEEQALRNKGAPRHATLYPSWAHRVDDRFRLAALLEQEACASPEGLDCADPTVPSPVVLDRSRRLCRDCADFGPVCPNDGKRCDGGDA